MAVIFTAANLAGLSQLQDAMVREKYHILNTLRVNVVDFAS